MAKYVINNKDIFYLGYIQIVILLYSFLKYIYHKTQSQIKNIFLFGYISTYLIWSSILLLGGILKLSLIILLFLIIGILGWCRYYFYNPIKEKLSNLLNNNIFDGSDINNNAAAPSFDIRRYFKYYYYVPIRGNVLGSL